jgi:hypothetical protein
MGREETEDGLRADCSLSCRSWDGIHGYSPAGRLESYEFFSLHRLGRFEFSILFFLEAKKENTHVIVIVAMRLLMPRLFLPLPGRRWLLWFTNFTVSAVELASSLFVHHQHESHHRDLGSRPYQIRLLSSFPFL